MTLRQAHAFAHPLGRATDALEAMLVQSKGEWWSTILTINR